MARLRRTLSTGQKKELESGKVSVSKLAKRLNLTLNQIWHIVYRDKIAIPKIWYTHFKMLDSSVKRCVEMKLLRDSGLLIKEIAFNYGLSQRRTSEIIASYPRILKYRSELCQLKSASLKTKLVLENKK